MSKSRFIIIAIFLASLFLMADWPGGNTTDSTDIVRWGFFNKEGDLTSLLDDNYMDISAYSAEYLDLQPMGASYTYSDTRFYIMSDAVNESAMYLKMTNPLMRMGRTAVWDSLFLWVYTDGVEDSAYVVLEAVVLDTNTINNVGIRVDSSAWTGGGVSGTFLKINVLNSDFTPVSNAYYRLSFECINNGGGDIKTSYIAKIVYHLE